MKTKVYIPNKAQAGELWEEVRTLRKNLKQILAHPNEWVLIGDKVLVGFFKTFGEGTTEGYKRFGLRKFIVQEVNDLTRPKLMR